MASVDYGDHLARTLPLWARLVPPDAITVVTAARDDETHAVAAANGVRCVATDAWTRHDTTFTKDCSYWHQYWRRIGVHPGTPVLNKALALDEAFGFVGERTPPPADGEVCLVADADCQPVGLLPQEHAVKDRVLYGCRRYELLAHGAKGPEMLIRGRATTRRTQHQHTWFVCQGYFQMFRWHQGMRFGSYPAADAYDDDFAHSFATSEEVPNFYVLHQGGMETTHKNWQGRVTARFEASV